jgi:uncharacterized Tic20 family protein
MKQPELGQNVARLRIQHEMTQEELAQACEVNVRSIQRIESGVASPRSSTARKLNTIFGRTISEPEADDGTFWLMLMHLSSIMPVVVFALIIWSWKREQDSRIDYQGIDVINFQLTMCLYLMIASALVFVVIGLLILPLLGIAISVVTVINSIKVVQGHQYYYPLVIRFLAHDELRLDT